MAATWTHDEVREMLPAAALEILDEADQRLIMAHARDCAECGPLLAEYLSVAGALVHLLPPAQLDPARSAAVRERLLARVRAVSGRRKLFADRWGGWMVAAAFAGLLLVHHAFHRPLAYGWLAAGALMLGLVALGVYARLQHGRIAALRDRLAALESDRADRQ